MKMFFVAAGIMLGTCSFAHADPQTAQCSMTIDGKSVLNGKCCVDISAAEDGSTGFVATLHAEAWRACVYDKQHPEDASLPSYKQRCLGPWIDIYEEKDDPKGPKTMSAYWSVEDACHGGQSISAVKTADGMYHGSNFQFTWKAVY